MIEGFKKFILRGNVVDLAVGVVIGAAFTALVNSIVKDLLNPFIGAIFRVPDMSGLSFTLRGSEFFYGNFLNAALSFLIVAIAVYFFVVTPINMLVARNKRNEVVDPTTQKCKECLSDIPIHAVRCAHCTQPV